MPYLKELYCNIENFRYCIGGYTYGGPIICSLIVPLYDLFRQANLCIIYGDKYKERLILVAFNIVADSRVTYSNINNWDTLINILCSIPPMYML